MSPLLEQTIYSLMASKYRNFANTTRLNTRDVSFTAQSDPKLYVYTVKVTLY